MKINKKNQKMNEDMEKIKSTKFHLKTFIFAIILVIFALCNFIDILKNLYEMYKYNSTYPSADFDLFRLFFIGIILIFFGLYLLSIKEYILYYEMSISFNDVKEVEYGTKDYDVQKELVKEIKHATLKEVPKIDTSKIGEQTLKFILTQDDLEKEVEYKITIKDTKAPEIKFKENSLERSN